MQGRPEPTNEAYAYAKISGMKMCEYIYDEFGLKFTSCMPTNVYGERDNFDPETSHVIPRCSADLRSRAERSTGSRYLGHGNQPSGIHACRRSRRCSRLAARKLRGKAVPEVGTGEDLSIRELAELIKTIVGYKGELVFDANKPDGMPKKLLDVSRLHAAGWRHKIGLEEGLRRTFEWYVAKSGCSRFPRCLNANRADEAVKERYINKIRLIRLIR